MPWIGEALSNGLKLSVRLSSGEDSMTRAFALELELEPELVLPPDAPVEDAPPDEQAGRAAARRPAAVSAAALLLLNLLIVNFDLSSLVLRFRGGLSLPCGWFLRLDGAARHGRSGDIQSPARRRPVGRQQLEGGVVPPAFVVGERAAAAERAADGGRADAPGHPRHGRPLHDVPGLERAAQVVRVG